MTLRPPPEFVPTSLAEKHGHVLCQHTAGGLAVASLMHGSARLLPPEAPAFIGDNIPNTADGFFVAAGLNLVLMAGRHVLTRIATHAAPENARHFPVTGAVGAVMLGMWWDATTAFYVPEMQPFDAGDTAAYAAGATLAIVMASRSFAASKAKQDAPAT